MSDEESPILPTPILDRIAARQLLLDGSFRQQLIRRLRSNVTQRRSLGDVEFGDILQLAAIQKMRSDP